VSRDGTEVTSTGRSFHMWAPATRKARRPIVGSLTAGTSRSSDEEDRSLVAGQSWPRSTWTLIQTTHELHCIVWWYWPMVFAKAVRYQMVPSRVEWRGETDNRATTPTGYCPSTAFLPAQPHSTNAWRDRCEEDLNSSPLGELEETTRMPLYYRVEDYPARPKIQ